MSAIASKSLNFHYEGPGGSSTTVALSLPAGASATHASASASASAGAGAVGGHKPTYEDIDRWLRQRLGFAATDRLQYLNKSGEEIIPGSGDTQIYVHRVDSSDKSKPKGDFGVFSSLVNSALWTLFISAIPPFIAVLVAIAVAPQHESLRGGLAHIKFFLSLLPIETDIAIEAYIAFLTWSSTYFFIRRAMNPETTSTVVAKYSADAFFGGLAAAGAAVLKILMIRTMKK